MDIVWKHKKERQNGETAEQYATELFEVIRRIANDRGLLKEFFEDILTPAEYKEIGKRWQIVKQLAAGRSQRDVAKNLHTGIATVTRGSREMLDKQGGFQKVLSKFRSK